MDEKFKHILNDDSQNNPFCRLQLVVEILRHSLIKIQEKSSKLLIRKRYYKTLGTSVINNAMSSPSLGVMNQILLVLIFAVLQAFLCIGLLVIIDEHIFG